MNSSGNLVPGKRLIFTITPGRSGTAYLAFVLSLLPGVSSRHEPEPRFSDVMRAAVRNEKLARDFWLQKKLPFIRSIREPIYVETSHLFCKGFVEPLLELGYWPDVIILKRAHRQVALSLYSLNAVPGRTPDGWHWLLSPDDPDVLGLPSWQDLHPYQLCYWYCLEIERRADSYRRLFESNARRVGVTSVPELKSWLSLPGFAKNWHCLHRGPSAG